MNQSNTPSKAILAFDANLVLVGMFSSFYTASKATGICHQMITKACSGEVIAAKNMYWREADTNEYVFDCDDLGKLTLLEFDLEQGVNRKIYATRNMRKNEIILESQYKNRYNITKQIKRKS